jgi:hypothetical protein
MDTFSLLKIARNETTSKVFLFILLRLEGLIKKIVFPTEVYGKLNGQEILIFL